MSGDLHCHSCLSDGSMEPSNIVDLASRLNINCIALTDHDTMDGIPEAVRLSKSAGVKVIPGMEVSAYDYDHDKKVHLLCYMPKKPEHLLEMCRETLAKRTEATLKMIERVSSRYPVTPEIVKRYAGKSKALYKQHISMALMDMGYSMSVFGDLYRSLFSKRNGWALIEFELPDFRDVIRLIKEAGGAAVLAHPGVYDNFEIISELVELGLDGIEVWHPRLSDEDTKRAYEAAERFHLIRTGGSDFHGMTSSKVTPLGTKLAETDELDKLLERFE
ncbi:MAG: PHP domain-containing protein [[Clostridium] cellulosi]